MAYLNSFQKMNKACEDVSQKVQPLRKVEHSHLICKPERGRQHVSGPWIPVSWLVVTVEQTWPSLVLGKMVVNSQYDHSYSNSTRGNTAEAQSFTPQSLQPTEASTQCRAVGYEVTARNNQMVSSISLQTDVFLTFMIRVLIS